MINKQQIKVPKDVRYLGNWKDFRFDKFSSKCIIDKQIPGCGFTEYCLNGPENVILCSPRKLLLWNKYKQNKDNVYLVVNELESDLGVDKDISKEYHNISPPKYLSHSDSSLSNSGKDVDRGSDVYKRICSEIKSYYQYRSEAHKPSKILVTYDSYQIVKDILSVMGVFKSFYTVIDEYQSILHDARFKPDTELGFMTHLKDSHSALFVSATPMMEDYMEMLDDFKDLPYYVLDWTSEDPYRVIKPRLKVLTMQSVGTKAKEIIGRYLSGRFDRVTIPSNGKLTDIISNEAVFYVNSVNHIISIIRSNDLTPEQCNILCSDTPDNKKKIKTKLGKMFSIGDVPVEGEQHKMFTFCTRTVYLGADFYSRCAQSYIFSDSNLDCLSVDISEDLPQILGRQRLSENPWKNEATFYYRTTSDYKKMTVEDLKRQIEKKQKVTNNLLLSFNSTPQKAKDDLARCLRFIASNRNYKEDYIAVDISSSGTLKPVINNLVLVNEIRTFKIQQVNYADRFSVFNSIYTSERFSNHEESDSALNKLVKKYYSFITLHDRLVFLCDSGIDQGLLRELLNQVSEKDLARVSYERLGPDKIRSCKYNRTLLNRALGIVLFNPESFSGKVYSKFHPGDSLSNVQIKETLGAIYEEVGVGVSPKATDISSWFETKRVKIKDPSGNWQNGIKLGKQKL